jgi:hypothetical protein
MDEPPAYPGTGIDSGQTGAAFIPGMAYKPEICHACDQPILIKRPKFNIQLTPQVLMVIDFCGVLMKWMIAANRGV